MQAGVWLAMSLHFRILVPETSDGESVREVLLEERSEATAGVRCSIESFISPCRHHVAGPDSPSGEEDVEDDAEDEDGEDDEENEEEDEDEEDEEIQNGTKDGKKGGEMKVSTVAGDRIATSVAQGPTKGHWGFDYFPL